MSGDWTSCGVGVLGEYGVDGFLELTDLELEFIDFPVAANFSERNEMCFARCPRFLKL